MKIKKYTVKNIKLNKTGKILLPCFSVILFLYFFLIPTDLFNDPFCTVITDETGELLGAHIAKDGQYRFPPAKNLPQKYKICVTNFEDKRFYYHLGFDFISFFRAVKQNLTSGKIVSGASTITMQVVRLSRKGKKRTIFEKIIELVIATRIEFSYSKQEILLLYASNAPFGGNIVGIEAASWRYFGKKIQNLTWAENATLAVLPNAPSLIHIGKNRKKLTKKRNRLLKKLYDKNYFDKNTYELAVDEPIPEKLKAFPNLAKHLLFRVQKKKKNNGIIRTSIIPEIQKRLLDIIEKHHNKLSENGIENLACIVAEVKTGKIIGYIGNTSGKGNNGYDVDIITSERSTGSVLKPMLYAAMLTEGEILPNSLVYDIPTRFGGYTPKNYSRSYSGAVPANMALARSLNIPAVRMLRKYGIEKMHRKFQQIGLTTLNKPASHYGLSLILGGCEGSLQDICGIYASMARTLNNYSVYGNSYSKKDFFPLKIYPDNNKKEKRDYDKNSYFDASAIYLTFKAMLEVERPGAENFWRNFSGSEKIAWKTGTSFGFRDAWAIGITPDYVVGVWAGNADGEGRPGLVGVRAAAPVLFDIFSILPNGKTWFKKPITDMKEVIICNKSGYIASDICPETDKVFVPKNGSRLGICPYHKIIHLDKTEKYRVSSDCESVENIKNIAWFTLPPSVEFYYKNKHSAYKYLPPFRPSCKEFSQEKTGNMELIYPYQNSKIYIPIEIDGKSGKTVFELAHRKKNITVFWYIDSKLTATTKDIHQVEIRPEKGEHLLTVLDETGEKIELKFSIISKK